MLKLGNVYSYIFFHDTQKNVCLSYEAYDSKERPKEVKHRYVSRVVSHSAKRLEANTSMDDL